MPFGMRANVVPAIAGRQNGLLSRLAPRFPYVRQLMALSVYVGNDGQVLRLCQKVVEIFTL